MIKTKIYGAPGTGKTTRLLGILAQEVSDGTPVDRIAFVTHTVAARREAIDRLQIAEDKLRFFRTIHGICYAQIGLHREQVMQASDYMDFGDSIGLKFSVNFTRDTDMDGLPFGFLHSVGNEVLAARQLAAAKMCKITDVTDSWPQTVDHDSMRKTLDAYREWKRRFTKFDFVDMLQMYMRTGEPIDADVGIIDEAQDLSPQQWQIVEKMMANVKRLYIAGDDDQSIYAFIGADRYGFLDHKVDRDEVLPKTWRLLDNVWRYAVEIIRSVDRRKDKNIQTRGEGGDIDYYNCDISRVPIKTSESTMFISRHNGQLDDLAEELTSRGIPFEGRGWTPYGSTAVRAINTLLSMRAGKSVGLRDAALVLDRTGNKDAAKSLRDLSRKDPAATITSHPDINVNADWVRYLARSPTDVQKNQIIRAILNSVGWPGVLEPPKVSLSTYHGSKGREADHVVLLTDCYRKAYDSARMDPDDERRISYVGVTRAKSRVSIILPQTELYMRALR